MVRFDPNRWASVWFRGVHQYGKYKSNRWAPVMVRVESCRKHSYGKRGATKYLDILTYIDKVLTYIDP